MLKKRGQATIFLIIALILLFSGFIYVYVSDKSAEQALADNPEIAPAKSFVDACMFDVATQGLRILGLNGGYIDIPDSIKNNQRARLQAGPAGNLMNPYWWYEGRLAIPSIALMEQELQKYVDRELQSCVDNFASLNQQLEIETRSPAASTVTINEQDVSVQLDYKITITSKVNQTNVRIDEFTQRVPIRLKKAYDAAVDIMNAENRDSFIEYKAIDLLALDPDIPTTDLEITCSDRTWLLPDIKDKMQQLLEVNLPYINVVGSEYTGQNFVPNPFGEDSYEASYFNAHYQWTVADKTYDDLRIGFSHDARYPMFINARPSSNGILRANDKATGGNLLDFLCFKLWHFTYDIDFPVMVSIYDQFDENPYQFNFAFMASIDHNQPNRAATATQLLDPINQIDEGVLCSDVGPEITIFTTTNASYFQEVDEVDLTLTCGSVTCDIGQTDFIDLGAAAGLRAQLPYCVNGILRGSKDGYQESEMFIQTSQENVYTLGLVPLKEFTDVEIILHDADDITRTETVSGTDTATISMSAQDSSYESFTVTPINPDFPLDVIDDDAVYDVQIFVNSNDVIAGAYQGTWTVDRDDLIDAQKVTFHAVAIENDEDAQIAAITSLDTLSEQLPAPEIQ